MPVRPVRGLIAGVVEDPGPVVISHGDRIAQMVVATVVQARFEVSSALAESGRGATGFGSTGID